MLATLLLLSDGLAVMPVVIVAVVVAYMAAAWMPMTPADLRTMWARSAGTRRSGPGPLPAGGKDGG
jgi:hypothetical protein